MNLTRLPFKLATAVRKASSVYTKERALTEARDKLRNRRLRGALSTQGHADLLAIEKVLEELHASSKD